jgi:hypothetical protein
MDTELVTVTLQGVTCLPILVACVPLISKDWAIACSLWAVLSDEFRGIYGWFIGAGPTGCLCAGEETAVEVLSYGIGSAADAGSVLRAASVGAITRPRWAPGGSPIVLLPDE